jgi:sugar lactone lactonase YvrE
MGFTLHRGFESLPLRRELAGSDRFGPVVRGNDLFMRRLLVVLGIVSVASVVLAAVAMASRGPDRLELPNGYRPEGIDSGPGKSVFVGSIPTGQVLQVDTKTGESREAVPGGEGRAAIGLKYDRRGGRLFVAGGPTGKAFVYDAESGAQLAALQLTPAGEPTFVNDVTLGRGAAYFTDSQQPVIYAVQPNGSAARRIELEGFPLAPEFNLNGIAAARGGRVLLAVQTATGVLWRIDSSSGDYAAVDLGGAALTNGDGLLLVGERTLLVVQNRLNQIAVVRLDRDYESGRVVGTITDPDFDVPTTVTLKRGSLYLPNARFTTPPTPETEYWVTRVGKGQ